MGYLNNFVANNPQKSAAWFPKRCMNIYKSEIAKIVKVTNNTIEYVSFAVPKRVNNII